MRRTRQRRNRRLRLVRAAAIAMIPISILTIIAMVATKDAPTPTETPTQAIEATSQQTTPEPSEAATEATPAPTDEPWMPDEADVEYIAKTIYGEANIVRSTMKQAAVAWCILNRVDAAGFPDTIEGVVTDKHQFAGYDPSHPVTEELRNLAVDVLLRWHSEQSGEVNVGRVLPKDYLWFTGDGRENYFTNEWRGAVNWNWSMPNPHEN
jgi:hypothetical protein